MNNNFKEFNVLILIVVEDGLVPKAQGCRPIIARKS